MNPSLPTVRPRQISGAAEKLGFAFDRQRGSHAVHIRESDGRRIVIPMDEGKDIRLGLLRSLISDMGITPEEFQELV